MLIFRSPRHLRLSSRAYRSRHKIEVIYQGIITARVSFVESGSICTEKRVALRIAHGILYEVTSVPLVWAPPTDTWRITQVDNETWVFRITMSDCQMGIGIRQLVRHERTWTPLLVPRDGRSKIERPRARPTAAANGRRERVDRQPAPIKHRFLIRGLFENAQLASARLRRDRGTWNRSLQSRGRAVPGIAREDGR
jgi:hypothetical protein